MTSPFRSPLAYGEKSETNSRRLAAARRLRAAAVLALTALVGVGSAAAFAADEAGPAKTSPANDAPAAADPNTLTGRAQHAIRRRAELQRMQTLEQQRNVGAQQAIDQQVAKNNAAAAAQNAPAAEPDKQAARRARRAKRQQQQEQASPTPATKPAEVAPATVLGGSNTRPTEAGEPFPPATPHTVVAVTEKIFPAVVRLDVAQEIYSEGKRSLQRGIGSGVIIDADGRILTNYHVAGRAAEIFVTLANKERVRGRLIGDDHWTDLAIVQLDADEMKRKNVTFKFAQLGTSDKLVPGQDVMAVGTPFGLARTMTLGVVSNNERTFYPDRMTIDEYETGGFANWIQMDTPINPGNSGGPLVDMKGFVIGINTRGGGQNLNFAVPVDTAKEVVAKILATAKEGKKGTVPRSDLGLDLKPLQDLESFYQLDINKGVLVNSVDRNSPAAKAGVKSQDILLEVNGRPVNVRFPEELAPARKMVADLPIGSDVSLVLKRGAETVTVKAKSEKLEGAVGQEQELKGWGLSVRDVTRSFANQKLLDDDKGVVVTTLSPGYPAAKAELQPGDIVRSVNNEPVEDLDALVKTYEDATKEKRKAVLLEVQRGRGRQTAVLKVSY